MIERVNEEFVSTWILIDEAKRLAKQGDQLAKTLASQWEYPMDLMFLNANGQLISKLNSFQDLKAAHPDVGHPPAGRGKTRPHLTVFLEHLDKHFPKDSARRTGKDRAGQRGVQ